MRTVLAGQGLCFIADAGLDDQKFFEYCGAQQVEFIIRAAHDRWVEVFNELSCAPWAVALLALTWIVKAPTKS